MSTLNSQPAYRRPLQRLWIWHRQTAYLHYFTCSFSFENRANGLVAQLVEQRTENPRVGSSILSQATIRFNKERRLEIVAFFTLEQELFV